MESKESNNYQESAGKIDVELGNFREQKAAADAEVARLLSQLRDTLRDEKLAEVRENLNA